MQFTCAAGDPAPVPSLTLRTEEEILRSWGGDVGKPVVSVRCTTYNQERFVADALRGFLIQETPFPFHIVVHDDASTDGTAGIVEDFRRQYPRLITLIRQPENIYSKGDKPHRHIAPFLTGKYVAVCEGDDYWIDPRKLAIQVEFLENNPRYVVSGHDIFLRVGDLVEATSYLPPDSRRDWSVAEMKHGDAWVPSVSRVYRNVPLEEAYESRFILNGDAFALSRLARHGAAKYHPEILPACYRRHSGGIWSTTPPADRRAAWLSSRLWMACYHRRIGDEETAAALETKVSHKVLKGLTTRQLLIETGRRIVARTARALRIRG